MLSIISMNRAGLSDGCLSVKVDFEFDNASTLPERVITVSGMSYIIAKDSTAKNTVTNVNYKYNGSKWVKVTETVEPVTGGTITDNGDYTIASNEYTGLSDISVDVAGGGGETFEVELELTLNEQDQTKFDVTSSKSINDVMSAIDDGDVLNLTITLDWGTSSEPLLYAMYSKASINSVSGLMVFGRAEDTNTWVGIFWNKDTNTASWQESTVLAINII